MADSAAMESKMEIKRASTTAGKRALLARAPKKVEKAGKTTLCLHGQNSSEVLKRLLADLARTKGCLLYTSPSPRDATLSRMPSSA